MNRGCEKKILTLLSVFVLSVAVTPVSRAEDNDKLSLLGKGMNSGFNMGYFDSDGNTPYSGEVKSSLKHVIDPKDPTISALAMHMTIAAGYSNYVGWYIYPKSKTIDISNQTVLRFEIKVDPAIPLDHLQIGVRSPNVDSDRNNAKVFLSELGYTALQDDFANVELPVSLLLKREPSLDLKNISEVFIVSIVSPAKDLTDKTVSIKNVRWDWDFTKDEEGKLEANILSVCTFDTGSYALKDDAKQLLQRIKRALVNRDVRKLVVSGHTDNTGNDALNLALSRNRAKAIADFLVKAGAVEASGVTVQGFGSANPISSNDTEEGRSANRRVELTALE